MFDRVRKYLRRRRYVVGARLTKFLVPDIRRDVEIVDVAEVDSGIVIARIRTWNVIYVAKGLVDMPEFDEPTRISIEQLWEWRGESWGGPVPEQDRQTPPKD